jgi:hypothetical protein
MKELGHILDILDFEKYIEISETYPIVYRTYGTPPPVCNFPHWTAYQNRPPASGMNAFTDHINDESPLREMQIQVARLIQPLLDDFNIVADRIRLMKSVGSLNRHIDEGGRRCCINIGLRNSSTAVTRYSYGTHIDFQKTAKSFRVEEGHAYLLNTNILHDVVGDKSLTRYLITYGFRESYDEVFSKLRL